MSTSVNDGEPEVFREAVESLSRLEVRPEISVGPIRPPQRLAPYSHALGVEIIPPTGDDVPEFSDGDAFGRLILLHDPSGDDAWNGTLRLVAYIQADMEASLAGDPLLPQVAWSWLTEALDEDAGPYTSLGGTVTSTASVRYGDISGPPQAHQLELRASWTPLEPDLTGHAAAFCKTLALAAGLPPVGVTSLHRRA
ncbi:DUF3000 domain-containing protein [Dietzia psychralcaliphila]|uniref:DUF3000 family protein n=1 Tax=Dietzia psychralcaliphila TaxID=139021 RepID=A0AAD0NND3_9ACTN|nr:DUF3000 domain-containing protein [Dietzia psychralcaliphila]AWH95606.1 hypothetical protein A6048_08945 [Dietzia psychralcaliphila]PTM88638.1 Protein of unknown function (DUF3000) [Dietzia psychralcaliphila]